MASSFPSGPAEAIRSILIKEMLYCGRIRIMASLYFLVIGSKGSSPANRLVM